MTIIVWILIGIVAAFLIRLLMPIPRDRGNVPMIIIGITAACAGGALSAFYFGGGITYFNPVSIGWAANAALYVLFASRCLSMSGA